MSAVLASPPTSSPEDDRLAALDRYDVLDTGPEETFERIPRIVRRVFDVPMASVNFIDGHRRWSKARDGLATPELPRASTFCAVAIEHPGPLVVTDALADERFRDNPYVAGSPHIRFYAGAPLRTGDGHNIGTLCAIDTRARSFGPEDTGLLTDLAAIVMNELELRMLATTDGLTGLLTRRAFREQAEQAVALALRHKHELACLVLDLDRFKAVNDGHGHGTGDLVLARVAETCRSRLRRSDLLGRVGGEELAIILPHAGAAGAVRVAENLRRAIARERFEQAASGLSVTASIGVAALTRTTPDLDSLLRAADTALYEAKGEGRNRCVLWRPKDIVVPQGRRRVLKAGRISFNNGGSTVDCTVRSLSDAGAGLDVYSSAGIPGGFKLQIEADGFYRSCQVMEKRDKHIEVAFS